MEPRPKTQDAGPGVPEALPRTLQALARALGPTEIDRLWVFPPLVKGRREWGLVSVSCFGEGGARHVMTARYSAERTGKGLEVQTELTEEGIAPPDRLPRVMTGVSMRSHLGLGEARVVEIGGKPDLFDALLAEFDSGLLEADPKPEPQGDPESEPRPLEAAES
jgi:hypothetical protein